jgi:predicted CXXCH cytochrome family protein
MKNILLLACGLLLGCFFSTKAHAGSSAHDFAGLVEDPCGACHSVHNATGGSMFSHNGPDITSVYNSPTMDHDILLDTINHTDAPMCLSCHDGAYARTEVSAGVADIIQGVQPGPVGVNDTDADLGPDMGNDHPVGFIFNESLDDEIKAPTNIHVRVQFGPEWNEMWCSTCHNVHNNQYPPFLNMANGGSALCYECHIK